MWLDRDEARRAVDLWTDAVRRLPPTHVAGPAAVLAFAAWLAGDGALAWCAVDRCREAEPDHSLAGLVAQLLDRAARPTRGRRSGPGWTAARQPERRPSVSHARAGWLPASDLA